MQAKYLVGLDEGTTSVRAVLYDITSHQIIKQCKQPITMFYPQNGWVEQDATQILQATNSVLNNVLSGLNASEVVGIGITNQRETVVAWNKQTKQPICNAIVWQCRRTSKRCKQIKPNIMRLIKRITGLPCDAYFSATKMEWILKNIPLAKELASQGNLCLGTVDSFLAHQLANQFVTDTSNASRTMLFSLKKLQYSNQLLHFFGIPKHCLASVVQSAQNVGIANTSIGKIPLLALVGDQQSALLAHSLNQSGIAKCTFGTGAFVMLGTGNKLKFSKRLITTVACTIAHKTTYALEGSIFNCGDAVAFLTNNLNIVASQAETSALAQSVPNTNGVCFVPAFTGLGAPHWDANARTAILGIEKSTQKAHIVRACLEGIAFSVNDVLNDMQRCNQPITKLHCDGGGSQNEFMLQWLSSISGLDIYALASSEQTVLGAVYLAGLSANVFDLAKLQAALGKTQKTNIFLPEQISQKQVLLAQWAKAVKKSKNWAN